MDPLFILGEMYRIQLKGDPVIKTLVFKRVVWPATNSKAGQELLFEFTEPGGLKTVIIPKAAVHAYQASRPEGLLFGKLFNLTVGNMIASHLLSKIIFHPYKTLAHAPGVTVVGSQFADASLARSIAENLASADDRLGTIGFTRPQKTRVIVGTRTIFPGLGGPVYVRVPMFNVWKWEWTKTLGIYPILWSKKFVKSDSVLYHERSHSFLIQTYNQESFVVANATVQEALADLLAAHLTNEPDIGTLRNIETRVSKFFGSKEKRTALVDINSTAYHDNSMVLSGVLWKVRKKLGAQQFETLIKPVVDALSQFRPSFEEFQVDELGKASKFSKTLGDLKDQRQIFINDFRYFLAVLRKVATEHGSRSFKQVVDAETRAFGLRAKDIRRIESALKRSQSSFAFDGKGELPLSVYAFALGTAGIAAESYLIYTVFFSDG